MTELILTIIGAFGFLALVGRIADVHPRAHPEVMRKLVHMTAGCVVATWPFYFTREQIVVLGVLALLVVLLSRLLHTFGAIHHDGKRLLGEALFAVAIVVLALITDNRWIFAAAVLHLGLADGSAAIIGKLWGKKTQYRIFGHTKSVVGTAMFFAVSVAIMTLYVVIVHHFTLWALLTVPVVATAVENIAIAGTDNLFVPLIVALLLTS